MNITKKIEDERVCVWSHMEHWLCYFYYKLLLFTADFKYFFMCGQIIIIICNGEVRDRGKGEGRVVVKAVPLIFYI